VRTKDPVTGALYEYAPQIGSRYQLCAVFVVDSRELQWPEVAPSWGHPRGRYCFSLDAVVKPPMRIEYRPLRTAGLDRPSYPLEAPWSSALLPAVLAALRMRST
jgi:hypothetical protein